MEKDKNFKKCKKNGIKDSVLELEALNATLK